MGDMADYTLDSVFCNDDWEWEEFIPHPPNLPKGAGLCPKCNSETKLKHGCFGYFFGCVTFPKCNGSRGVFK